MVFIRYFSSLILFCILFYTAAYAQNSAEPYAPWLDNDIERVSPSSQSALPEIPKNLIIQDDVTDVLLSPIEELYANRIIDAPKQFGYDLFVPDNAHDNATITPMGAVQDDYLLGQGDTLRITFTGQRNDQDDYKIDALGMLSIKDFPPINVVGRTLKQVRDDITNQANTVPNTKAYVSLSSLRQINVLIVGNVKHPGRKTLNSFNTVIDALTLTGGINKDGSLRNIKLVRDGRSILIDLYALLLHGAPGTDISLHDGDRIIIPPLGPTVAIAGAVKRPGIYEIKRTHTGINGLTNDNSEKLNLNEMLGLSGGVLSAGQNRLLKISSTNRGEETITEVTDPFDKVFGDGTILSVVKGGEKRSGTIELVGNTRRPGFHDLSRNKTLSALLHDESVLGDDIYPLIGVIERWNADQMATQYIKYPVRLVLKNEFDLTLQNNDVIWLLSNRDITSIYDAQNHEKDKMIEEGSRADDAELLSNESLSSFIKEQSVFIRGAVRRPGAYPVAEGITLDNIIAVAGGLTLDANRESIEVTSKNLGDGHQSFGRSGTQRTIIDLNTTQAENITLSSGDTIRINQKFRKTDEKTVLIIGEVLHPGEYDVLNGDKVSDLIERAGGLTQQAYPEGSIFSRESERKSEELRFRKAAHDMRQRLAAAVEREKNSPDATQIDMVRSLADELTDIQAVGRITVETNPAILTTHPELDMFLEKGDRLYIPKRPLTVRVSGEVLSPASLQFRESKDPIDYIHEAGGFTYHADKDRTFVIYPDGSAEPLQVNTWNHKPIFIPPGSTIIIPRDPKPFDFMESAKDVGQILSNLAITSVFIDDIRD